MWLKWIVTLNSLLFYSKDKAINFNNIKNTDDFKCFRFTAKLLGNTLSKPTPNQAIGILENVKITVPLKYLNNFWRSLCHWLVTKLNWKLDGLCIVFFTCAWFC